MADENDDGREQRLLALALLKKAGQPKYTPIEPRDVLQLWLQAEHRYMGLGSSNMYVSPTTLQEIGVDPEIWRKAGFAERPLRADGKKYFEVPADFTDRGLRPVMDILYRGVGKEMAQIERQQDARRQVQHETGMLLRGGEELRPIGREAARALLDAVTLKRAAGKRGGIKLLVTQEALENAGVDVARLWKPRDFKEIQHDKTRSFEVPDPMAGALVMQLAALAEYDQQEKIAFSKKHDAVFYPGDVKVRR